MSQSNLYCQGFLLLIIKSAILTYSSLSVMERPRLEQVTKAAKGIAKGVISSPWVRGGLSSWIALGGAPLDVIGSAGNTQSSEQVISSSGITVTRIHGDGDIGDIGMLIAGQYYPNDSAFLDSARLATDYLFQVEPFKSRQSRFSVYALASQNTPYLECTRERGFICEGGREVNMINDVNNAIGIPMLETLVLVNVPDFGAAAGRDQKNPPNIYTSTNLTEGALRWELGKFVTAHEWGGHATINLGEEYHAPDQPPDLYINCVSIPEVAWRGIPGALGRQFEGCGNSEKQVWKDSEKSIMGSYDVFSFGPVGIW